MGLVLAASTNYEREKFSTIVVYKIPKYGDNRPLTPDNVPLSVKGSLMLYFNHNSRVWLK